MNKKNVRDENSGAMSPIPIPLDKQRIHKQISKHM